MAGQLLSDDEVFGAEAEDGGAGDLLTDDEVFGQAPAESADNRDPRDMRAERGIPTSSAIEQQNQSPLLERAGMAVRRGISAIPDLIEPAAVGEFRGSEISKGAETGVTGAKQMGQALRALSATQQMRYLQSELSAMDAVDRGQAAPKAAGPGAPGQMPYAEAYAGMAPDEQQELRQRLIKEAAGRKESVEAATQAWQDYQREMRATRGRVPDLTDVEDVRGFGDWLAFNMGQGSVYMVPMMIAALGGAPTLAAAGYALGAGDLASDRMGQAVGDQFLGAPGVGRPSAVEQQMRPEAGARVAGELERSAGTIGALAIPYAAADVALGPAAGIASGMIKRAGKQAAESAIQGGIRAGAKIVGKEALKQGAEEALGEGAQEFLQSLQSTILDDESLWTGENAKRWLNAAAAGAAPGAVFGGGAAGAHAGAAAAGKKGGIPSAKGAKPEPTPASGWDEVKDRFEAVRLDDGDAFRAPNGAVITPEQWDGASARVREQWLAPLEAPPADTRPVVGGIRVDEEIEAVPAPDDQPPGPVEQIEAAPAPKERPRSILLDELERASAATIDPAVRKTIDAKIKAESARLGKLPQAEEFERLAAETSSEILRDEWLAKAAELRGSKPQDEMPVKPTKRGIQVTELEEVEAIPVPETDVAAVNAEATSAAEGAREAAHPDKPKLTVAPEPIEVTRSKSRLLQMIARAGGISESERAGMGLDRKNAKGKRELFMLSGKERGPLFRKGGAGADRLLELLEQNGFMTAADIERLDREEPGGAHERAREIIREELLRPGSMRKAAESDANIDQLFQKQRDERVLEEAEDLGISTEGRTPAQLKAIVEAALRADWTAAHDLDETRAESAAKARLAHELDAAAVEDAARQFSADDAGFMAAVERIIDEHKQTASRRSGDAAASVSAMENQESRRSDAGGEPTATSSKGADRGESIGRAAESSRRAEGGQPAQPAGTERAGTTGSLTGESDAQEIRSDARPVREGNAGQGRKDKGGEDLQRPAQAKPEAGNEEKLSLAAPFYSELAKQVEAVPSKAMPAADWRNRILTLKGVKSDEVQWSGVIDWLRLQTGKVTKDQVTAFLRENGVRVEETQLGKPEKSKLDRRKEVFDRYQPKVDELRGQIDAALLDRQPTADLERKLVLLMDERDRVAAAAGGEVRETKFGAHQLPGGENYRELLLTLPERGARVPPTFEEWHAKTHVRPLSEVRGNRQLMEIAQRQYDRDKIAFERNPNTFRSAHFDRPNILAHIRFNERTDADGKRVLFIEEIQSDWAQKGKREGFRKPDDTKDLVAKQWSDNPSVWEVSTQAGVFVTNVTTSDVTGELGRPITAEQAIAEAHRRLAERPASTAQGRGVPPAPFVGKTEAWVALAMKRMIRYAADNGFDRVAWTTGEQQAERYDLSKQISEVRAQKMRSGLWHVEADDKSGGAVIGKEVDDNGLPDVVGKELAQKIVERGGGTFAGLDLKIGGEGMRAFYDKIVPNVAKDVLKKLGGDGLRAVSIPAVRQSDDYSTFAADGGFYVYRASDETYLDETGEWTHTRRWGKKYATQAEARAVADDLEAKDRAGQGTQRTQPGFDITQALRDSAMGGMPMFSIDRDARRAQDAPHEAPTLALSNEEQSDAVANLQEKMRRRFGRPAYVLRIVRDVASGVRSQDGAARTRAIASAITAKLFDISIIWVEQPTGRIFDGIQAPWLPRAIFVDVGQKKPLLAVTGHELLHSLRQARPDLYADLLRGLLPLVRNEQRYRDLLNAKYEKEGGEALPEDSLREELIADIVGDRFMEPEFWAELGRREPERFGRIGRAIIDFLDRLIGKVKEAFGTSEYLTDLVAARKAVADAVAKFSTGEVASKPVSRPYQKAPDNLLGYRKSGPQKGFGEQRYRHREFVRVTWKGGDSILDAMDGLNRAHALERAHRNWRDAKSIEAVPRENALLEDPRLVLEVDMTPRASEEMLSLGTTPGALADETKLQTTERLLFDRFNRVTQAERAAAAPDEQSIRLAEKLFHGKAQYEGERLERKFIEPLGRALKAAKKIGLTVREVDEFLIARHARERNAVIALRNPQMPDGGSGYTNAQAAAILAAYTAEQRIALAQISKIVDGMNADRLRRLVSRGLITPETRRALKRQYRHYVPLKTLEDEDRATGAGRGYELWRTDIKTAMGRSTRAFSPIAATIMDATRAIVRGEKARVEAAIWKFASDTSNADVMRPYDNQHPPREVMKRKLDATGTVTEVIDPIKVQEMTLHLMVAGQEQRVFIPDETLRNQLRKAGEFEQIGRLLQGVSVGTRTIGRMLTEWNPTFTVPNAVRDAISATVRARGIRNVSATRVLAGIPHAWKAIFDYKRGVDTPAARDYVEFEKAGGKTGAYGITDARVALQRLSKLGAELGYPDQEPGRVRRFARHARVVLDALSAANEILEYATRLSTYQEARRAGYSVPRAAEIGKEITVNFNRAGEMGRTLNSLFVFTNAALQGLYGTINYAKSPRVRRGMYALAVAGFVMQAFNEWMGGDDDESGEPNINTVSDFKADNNFTMLMPGKASGFTIPLPPEYAGIYAIGRRLYRAMSQRQFGREALGIAGAVLQSTLPARIPEASSGPLAVAKTVTPTVLLAPAEVLFDENYFGEHILPRQRSETAPQPWHVISKRGTSDVAKGIAEIANTVTGGDRIEPGAFQDALGPFASPEAIEHLVTQYTGGLGKFVMQSKNVASGTAELNQAPIVSRFAFTQPKGYAGRRYKELATDFQYAIQRQNQGLEIPDAAVAQSLDAYRSAETELRGIYPRLRAAEEAGDKETTEALREQIASKKKGVIRAYTQAREATQ